MDSSLGNHEFDNGVKGLTPFIENLTCPILAANLLLKKEPTLEQEVNLKKSIVLTVKDVKIGIIGYLTPTTKTTAKQNNVEYRKEVEAIKEQVKILQEEDVKIIIALGHSGFSTDIEIAREVDGLDLVIGGHSNTFLWNGTSPDSENIDGPYPLLVKQSSGKTVPVVQAYAYTKYLGKLLMKFDGRGNIIGIEGAPILLDESVPQDLEVLQIVERYQREVSKFSDYQEVIGNTKVVLDGQSCRREECNLGNLITDAMVYHFASHWKGEYWADAPIAILQGGGIRTSIAHFHRPAAITKGDLLATMPFEGQLVAVTMNGSILLEMLEHSVANYDSFDETGEFLQLSGLKVVYNLTNPAGSRVETVVARCGQCDVPDHYSVEEEQMYGVIMPDFLLSGGDGYSMFAGLPSYSLPHNPTERTCTEEYIIKHSPIYPDVQGRITLLKKRMLRMLSDSADKGSPRFYLIIITFVMYFSL